MSFSWVTGGWGKARREGGGDGDGEGRSAHSSLGCNWISAVRAGKMFSPRSPCRGVLAHSGFPTSLILSRLVQLIGCFLCSPSVICMSRCSDTCFTMLCSWIKGLESSRPPLVLITCPLPQCLCVRAVTYAKLTLHCRFTIFHKFKVNFSWSHGCCFTFSQNCCWQINFLVALSSCRLPGVWMMFVVDRALLQH